MNYIIFVILLACFSVNALADVDYYNNTSSTIAENVPNTGPDAGPEVVDAYIYRHTYGFNLVSEVCMENKGYDKEIYVHELSGKKIVQSSLINWKAHSAPFALSYFQPKNSPNTECFTFVTHTSPLYAVRFVVEVKMGGQDYWTGYVTVVRRQ
jgi:hypothetical protein